VTDRLRVATLNTWGVRGDWPARRAMLSAGFARLGADFLLLQETTLRPEVDQVCEVLGDRYHLAHSRSRDPDGQGTTIASRWPIGNVVELDLHVTGRTHDFACSAAIAEVDVPEPVCRVWLVNHFPDYQVDHENERLLQTLVVAREVESAADRPDHVILGGDLDAEPDADSLRFLTGRHVVEGLSVVRRAGHDRERPLRSGRGFGRPGRRLSVHRFAADSVEHGGRGAPTGPTRRQLRVAIRASRGSNHGAMIFWTPAGV
jgi:endonuclease/exonuclease/phosphatase family metal-dependent hydrolase